MLKRIELYGFKSFAEKTVLTFNDALTGIVGPNGSGKSNIVDAIKWCLGEQALSQIRCKNPLDVIFAGSETKPPLNYCEVTVVFDNESGVFPVDYQEVEITRRIYRNGETEYFINRVACRLKDIKDLVLDTGLTSTGYGIIPQGKVDFVINAKPEERRLLFEETAGVAKYKSRREEALRKLERVKQDMLRVEDILAYLKDQMVALESAVRKAKNYQKYKEELQVLECANVVKQVCMLEDRIKKINNEHTNLTEEYTSYINELANNEAESVKLKTICVDLEKELLTLKDKLAKLQTEISLCSQRIENYKDIIKNSQENIVKLNSEIKELLLRNENYDTELNQLKLEQQRISELLMKVEEQKNYLQQEYDKYKSLISQKQEMILKKNKQLTQQVYLRTKLQNDLASSTRRMQHFVVETNSLKKDAEINKKTKQEVEKEIEVLTQKITLLKNEKDSCETQIQSISEQIKQLQQIISEKTVILDNKNKEYYTLRSKLDNLTMSITSQPYNLQRIVKYLENSKYKHSCVVVKSILKINPEKYPLVATYLGNRLYWFIVENEDIATEIIHKLKEENLGYATFVIKGNIERINFVDLNQNLDISSLVDFDPQWTKIVQFLFSNIKIENDILKTPLIMHGGSYSTKEAQQDLYSIETQVNNLFCEIQQETETLTKLNSEFHMLVSQKTLLEKKVSELDTENNFYVQQKLQKENYLKELVEFDSTLQFQLEKYQTEMKEIDNTINSLNQEISVLESEEKKIHEEIAILSDEIKQLQSSKVVDEYLKINSEHSKLQEQINNINSELNTKQEIIQTNIARINALNLEIDQLQKFIQKTQQDIVSEEEKLDNYCNLQQELQKKLAEVEQNLVTQRTKYDEIELQIKLLTTKKEELQQKIKLLELELNSCSTQKTNFSNWLLEKYNISLDEAKNLYSNIEVDPQHLERLKKRIESMGAINLAAPEEYAQLEEKYNTLLTQQQDLLKSQQDIKQAIAQINEKISNNFKETFLKVRENFKKICNILFEGGKAELVLTNEDNLLESGIDIIVQPPGKKLQHIYSLSGGEKSLAALALLFSFFMVKPAPICILDEADAQLDEANIVRFMKLLKEFSSSVKFILITHVVRTMEFLDTIYGISMEEMGVSKVISLKLQKEEVVV